MACRGAAAGPPTSKVWWRGGGRRCEILNVPPANKNTEMAKVHGVGGAWGWGSEEVGKPRAGIVRASRKGVVLPAYNSPP